MKTYYQRAHNQVTIEMSQRVQQLMNSHHNIALLADFEQAVNVSTNSKPKPLSDTRGTDSDNTTPKMQYTAVNSKHSVTGCISLKQHKIYQASYVVFCGGMNLMIAGTLLLIMITHQRKTM